MSLSLNTVIEPETLQALLAGSDMDLCLVDLSSEANYLAGHIPGAVYLPFPALLSGQAPAAGLLPDQDRLQKIVNFLGLTPNTHVIAYDDEGGGWAGRLLWTLDVLGHEHWSYLNGGIHAWRLEQRPLTTDMHQRPPTNHAINITGQGRALLEDVILELEQKTSTIWDARSRAEYLGVNAQAQRVGRMPDAINCEWTQLMDQNNGLRIREDARDYLLRQGIDDSKPIITHCQSHHRSAFTYVVGKHLGFDIRGYDGSWSQWGNRNDTPIEK